MDDKRIKVLLIEDNPGDARLIQEMLSEDGHHVFELVHADQLSKGFECLERGSVDVILLDLGLPDSQGIDTLNALLSKAQQISIIVQTGLADEELAIKAVKAGAQDYLIKGQIDSRLLSRSIRYAIERKKMTEELRETRDYLQKLNDELERRVAERTAHLEAANKDLEAFSYSVSHDLRAPLRSIDGFSQIVLEDYTDKLDDQGKDYLGRIRAASQRMALLIDDLLNLSRISQAELSREQVNLSNLATSILEELKRNEPARQVEFLVQEGLIDSGDQRLLRIVLENLLGNAWKFTSKHARAKIEFGQLKIGMRDVYFVRDNGAGFDMAYADKLFVPFQRLHSLSEFSGTGIGLATVQRIIQRHGGAVWAEGALGKGATFYFSFE